MFKRILAATLTAFAIAGPALVWANASIGRWAAILIDGSGNPQISCIDDVALSAIRVTKAGGGWSGTNVTFAQAATTSICLAGPAMYLGSTSGVVDNSDCPPNTLQLILPVITNTSTLSFVLPDHTCSPCPCNHLYYGASLAGTGAGKLCMSYLDDWTGQHYAYAATSSNFGGPYTVSLLGAARDDLYAYWTGAVFGQDGNPRVVYTGTDGPVVCARFNGLDWVQTTIDGGSLPAGYRASWDGIVVDSNGKVHVVFVVNGASLWSVTETVANANTFGAPVELAPSVTIAPGIAAGDGGTVYVGYGRSAGGQLHEIRVVTDANGSTSDESVEIHGMPVDLSGLRVATAYSGGVVSVAYGGNDSDGGLVLWYASRTSVWNVEQAWPQPAPPPPPPDGSGGGGHSGRDDGCGCGIRQVASSDGIPSRFTLESIQEQHGRELGLILSAPRNAHLSLSLFDLHGREISRLQLGSVHPGKSVLTWNVGKLARGVYFVRADEASSVLASCKVVEP